MSHELGPSHQQIDFFNRLMGIVTGVPEDKRSFGTRVIPMRFIDAGFIFDPAGTLPEHMIILQAKSPYDYESPNRRTLCVEFSANRFRLMTYKAPDSLADELERQKSKLNQRKNPDVITDEELRTPGLDPMSLFGFARGAREIQRSNEEYNYKERLMTPDEINTIVTGLSVLTDPVNITQAEAGLKPFFYQQFE